MPSFKQSDNALIDGPSQRAIRSLKEYVDSNYALQSDVDATFLTFPRGWEAVASATSNQTGISTVADLTSLTGTVTTDGTRRFRIGVMVRLLQNTSAGIVTLTITDSSNNQLAAWQINLQAAERASANLVHFVTPSSGSPTYKARLTTNAGTVDSIASSTAPAWFWIEDIGPA